MKRPSFQFYAGDWRSNAKLRRCSHAERGIWLEVLCLMHDSERYGVLDWPLKDVSQAVGCKVSELQSIVRKQVMKGAETGPVAAFIFTPRHAGKDGDAVTLIAAQLGPLWYSSRMVRDDYVRSRSGGETRFKPPPDPTPKPSPSQRHGEDEGVAPSQRQGQGASSSIFSTTTSPNGEADEDPWLLGKEFLINRGVSKSTVGGFIAGLCREYGKEAVVKALQRAIVEEPAEVKSFIIGVLKDRPRLGKFDPTTYNLATLRR